MSKSADRKGLYAHEKSDKRGRSSTSEKGAPKKADIYFDESPTYPDGKHSADTKSERRPRNVTDGGVTLSAARPVAQRDDSLDEMDEVDREFENLLHASNEGTTEISDDPKQRAILAGFQMYFDNKTLTLIKVILVI
jgi:hypothetical protein